MSTVPLRLSRQDLLRTVAALQAAGGQAAEAVPLYRAAIQGLRLIRVVRRDQPFPAELVGGSRPTMLVIGDDDFQSTGPAAWCCAREAMSWPATVMIYAGAARREIYQHAVDVASRSGRLLLVETTAEHAAAWYARIPEGMPTLVIAPPPGAAIKVEAVH